jgi:hypothetical protein
MHIVVMNPKIAHEAPISILNEVQQHTDYCYALVHLFETHPEYYNFFYKARHKLHRDVLLDNSIFELGEAFDSEKYADWIAKLQPSYYVLPDVLEDGEGTIENFIKFSTGYTDLPGVKIGTVQGRTYDELVNCYRFMSENADMIAISFDLRYYQGTGIGSNALQRQCNGRIRFVKNLIADGIWNFNKPHHLLGCSLAKEFRFYKEHCIYNIHSIDTSNPVVAGIKGLLYNGEHGLEIKPSQKLVEMIDHEVTEEEKGRIRYNINHFKRIVSNF